MTDESMEHMHGGMGDHGQPAQSATFGVHNQMMVGQQTIYLSHLPMFMFDPKHHEHNFQVILEVTLTGPGQAQTYARDRQKHSDVRMYTMSPRAFDMLELDPRRPQRTELTGDVFRGHLERGGVPILEGVTAHVENVVYFHAFVEGAKSLDQLEYILFGQAPDLFLAHVITRPPDFDQILGVKISGGAPAAADLKRGVRVKVPKRQNTAHERVKARERFTAQAEGGQSVELEAVAEFYFEEGELQAMMNMRPTPEEKKAGF